MGTFLITLIDHNCITVTRSYNAEASYFSGHSDDDFGLVSLFADLAVDTLPVFNESVDDSIYHCFNNYHVDCTLHSEDDLGLISLFEPSTAVALPLAKNVDEISGSDDEPDNSPLKEIYSGQTFTSFDLLEKCLKRYSMRMGFETKIVRAEKENNVMAHKTYKCRHGGKYLTKTKLDPTQNRKRESSCIECGFMLSASYLQQFSRSSHKIPTNIKEEIRFYVQECHLGATILKRILRNKFPNQDIYSQDLYNIINQYKADATNNLQPATIFTDADPAMQVALSNKYPNTTVRHCAFHIQQNLVKKLKRKLNNKWDKFISDFYTLRNSLIVSEFDRYWIGLMDDYPEVQAYCEWVLYPTKESWAHAFTKRSFSANTHSTQRVESINRVIKLEVNSGNSLYQLQSGIELRLKDEDKYAKFQEFRNINLTTGLPYVSNIIFKRINDLCKKYLTPNSLALQ
ncbi:16024_t:CDS:2 [Gigaspora rosea]|nr:16024_t:CDS:2 [Gigaspora rosea]